MSATLFTQFKQWIELFASGEDRNQTGRGTKGNNNATQSAGVDVAASHGAYFEAVGGGEVSYNIAEAALANSRGTVYRSTRFRISELNLRNTLDFATFVKFADIFEDFRYNGDKKLSVRRVMIDGEGNRLVYVYTNCSVIQPPSIDDGDVARDSEFYNMQIRLQPEGLTIYKGDKTGSVNTILMRFDADEALDGSNGAENTTKGAKSYSPGLM